MSIFINMAGVIEKSKYEVIHKDINDILNDLKIDENDLILTKDIINGIESTAADYIKKDKTVSLPYLGTVRRNPIKKKLTEDYDEMKNARETLTREQFLEFYKNKMTNLKLEQKNKDREKHANKINLGVNKAKYEELCITVGKAYADAYIFAITHFTEVEFDQEIQDKYDEINNRKNVDY